jgi:hypothetical protein
MHTTTTTTIPIASPFVHLVSPCDTRVTSIFHCMLHIRAIGTLAAPCHREDEGTDTREYADEFTHRCCLVGFPSRTVCVFVLCDRNIDPLPPCSVKRLRCVCVHFTTRMDPQGASDMTRSRARGRPIEQGVSYHTVPIGDRCTVHFPVDAQPRNAQFPLGTVSLDLCESGPGDLVADICVCV